MAADNRLTLQVLADTRDLLAKLTEVVQRFDTVRTKVNQPAKFTLDIEAANKQIAALESQIAKLQSRLSKGEALSIKIDTASLTKSIATAEKEVEKAEKAVARHLREIEKEAKRNIFGGLSESARKEGAKLTAEFQKITSGIEAAAQKARRAQAAFDIDPSSSNANKLRAAQTQVKILAQEFEAFGQRAARASGLSGPALEKLRSQVSAVAAEAKKLSLQSPLGPSFTTSLTNATTAMKAFIGVLSVQGFTNFVNQAREAATQVDLFERRLSTLTGSIPKAQQELASLFEFSNKFGLNFQVVAEQFARFATTANSLGIPLADARSQFEAISIAAAGAGTNAQNLEGIFTALTQIMSKGTVQAEELRGQLGDRLPGSFAAMARAVGVTTEELNKMLKAGDVLAGETIPKFAAELLKTFESQAIANIGSAASEMARFENAVFNAKVTIGKELLPALNELLSVLVDVGTEGEAGIKKVGDALADLLGKVTNVSNVIRDLLGGNLKAVYFDLRTILLQLVQDLQSTVNTVVSSVAGLFSDKLAKAIDATAAKNKAFVQELIDGSKILAQEARGNAKNIAEAYNQQANDVRDSISKLQKSLTDQSNRQRDEAIANAKAVTEAQKAEFAKIKASYEELVTELSKKGGAVTDAEKKELDKRRRAYEDLQKILVKKEEEVTAKTKAELEKRTKEYEGFRDDAISALDDLAQAASNTDITPKVGPTETPQGSFVPPQANAEVQRLTDSLNALRAERDKLNSGPFVDFDSDRMTELNFSIAELESKVRNAPRSFEELNAQLVENDRATAQLQAQTEKFSASFAASIQKMVLSNDGFAQSFQKLTPAGQEAVQGIISNYQRLTDAGIATASDVQEFQRKLALAFQEGGAAGTGFADALSSSLGGAQTSAQKLAEGFDKLKTAGDTSGNALQEAGTAAAEAKTGLDEASTATGDAATGMEDTAKAAGEAAPKVTELATAAKETAVAVGEFSSSLAGVTPQIQAIIEIGPQLAPVLEAIGAALSENTGPVGDVGALYLELAGHLRLIAEDGPKAVEAIEAISAAGSEQGEGMAALVESFTNLVAVVTPVAESLDKAKLAIEAIQTAAEEMPEVVDALSAAFEGLDVEPFIEAANQAKEAVTGTREEVESVADATERWGQALETVRSMLEPVAETMLGLKQSATELAESLTSGVNPALLETARAFADLAKTTPIVGDVFRFMIEKGPEGFRDLTEAIKELAAAMRDDATPAAQGLAEAVNRIQLPQGA